MKTNGANWKAYMNSWPEGQWFDESDETINGQSVEEFEKSLPKGKGFLESIPDDAEIVFTAGVVFANADSMSDGVSLTTHFRRWVRTQDTQLKVVQVPSDAVDAFTEFCRTHKIKIQD